MAITSYASLASAVATYLDVSYSDISSVVSDVVTNAEKRIFREVRNADMEAAFSGTIASGVLAVPADFIDMKFAYVDTNPVLQMQMRPAAWMYERYPTRSASGVPRFMAREATNFIFGPFPDSDYTIKGIYFKRLDPVQTSTNALLTANPDLYLYASLAETESVLGPNRDKRIPLWEARYTRVKELIHGEYERGQYGGPISVELG